MKKYISILILLIAIMALICTACPEVTPEKDPDPSLIGDWSNNKTGNDAKTFIVNDDFSFSCHINPGADGNYQGAATVSGKLTRTDGNIYTMYDLKGVPDDPGTVWTNPLTLGAFNSQKLLITFYDKDSFNFKSAQNNDAVTQYFGGDYYRK